MILFFPVAPYFFPYFLKFILQGWAFFHLILSFLSLGVLILSVVLAFFPLLVSFLVWLVFIILIIIVVVIVSSLSTRSAVYHLGFQCTLVIKHCYRVALGLFF